jgi:hypothetical protein
LTAAEIAVSIEYHFQRSIECGLAVQRQHPMVVPYLERLRSVLGNACETSQSTGEKVTATCPASKIANCNSNNGESAWLAHTRAFYTMFPRTLQASLHSQLGASAHPGGIVLGRAMQRQQPIVALYHERLRPRIGNKL